MPLLIKRYEKYRKHFAYAVPQYFVCAQCGGKLVDRWHVEGSSIQCAGDVLHEGLVTEQAWLDMHPAQTTDAAVEDAIALDDDVAAAVKGLRRHRQKADKEAMDGDGD